MKQQLYFAAGVLAFILGVFLYTWLSADLDSSFEDAEIRDGRPCTANVLSTTATGTTLNRKRVYELQLEVKPADGAEYEATVRNALNSFEAGRAGAATEFRCVIHRTDPSRIHVFWSELKPN